MTRMMIEVLQKLFRSEGHANWVTLSTAWALERRGLATRKPHRQRTGGRYFPEYWTTLTEQGLAYCLRHYQKIGQKAAKTYG
jgi:hypothetical protein